MKAISTRVPELTSARRLVAHQLQGQLSHPKRETHVTMVPKTQDRRDTAAASNASERVVRRMDIRFSLRRQQCIEGLTHRMRADSSSVCRCERRKAETARRPMRSCWRRKMRCEIVAGTPITALKRTTPSSQPKARRAVLKYDSASSKKRWTGRSQAGFGTMRSPGDHGTAASADRASTSADSVRWA